MKSSPHEAKVSSWDRPWGLAVAIALLIAGVLLVYQRSLHVPFVLDDADSITDNPTIRSFATALFPPASSGITVSGRPFLNLSLAINYRFGGTDPFGYHVGNLLIHCAAALCLFGVVRRTLRLPSLAPRLGSHATPLAWFTAAWWALHPLQTESVTYVIQRAESLMGLCYLFTCYAFIRAVQETSRSWAIGAFVASLLGMATKEVTASLPLVLFLYDRTFVSGTFRESWRRHRRLHLGFASGWLLLAGFVIASGSRGATVGYDRVTWLDYLITQGAGVAAYLGKALLPIGLIFDYGPIVEKRPAVIFMGGATLLALGIATLVLLKKRPAAGFLGAWFFLILAPTSSVIPVVSQTLAEHRMYLPLAAVCVTGVLLCERVGRICFWGALPLVVLGTAVAAMERNDVYRTPLSLWLDTAHKVPDNPRALNNLGLAYLDVGRVDDAIRSLTEAVELVPKDANTRANLGTALLKKGVGPHAGHFNRLERSAPAGSLAPRQADATAQGLEALKMAAELAPNNARIVGLYGNGLLEAGQAAAAVPVLVRAVALDPASSDFHFNLANALNELDRQQEAAEEYIAALRVAPTDAEVLTNYGLLLRRMNRLPESIERLREAVRLKPGSARVHSNFGVSLLAAGQAEDGIRELTEALRLDPKLPQALYNLSTALAQSDRPADAIAPLETLLQVAPPTAELLSNLGVLLARTGRMQDALARTRQALTVDPNYPPARDNLALLTSYLRDHPEDAPSAPPR